MTGSSVDKSKRATNPRRAAGHVLSLRWSIADKDDNLKQQKGKVDDLIEHTTRAGGILKGAPLLDQVVARPEAA